MRFSTDHALYGGQIVALFTAAFTAAEGAEEGALIGDLARRLMAQTPKADLRSIAALEPGADKVIGAVLLSRLCYPAPAGRAPAPQVFVLAPVAVAPGHQRQGIGQAMLAQAMAGLRAEGVDLAVTYGDPAYYGRAGFAPMREADLPAPYRLSHPEGWLAQALGGRALTPLAGPARCAAALDDPRFW